MRTTTTSSLSDTRWAAMRCRGSPTAACFRHQVYFVRLGRGAGRTIAELNREQTHTQSGSFGRTRQGRRRHRWVDLDLARSIFYPDCDDEIVTSAIPRLRVQAREPMSQRCTFDRLPSIPATYIVCAGRPDGPIQAGHDGWRRSGSERRWWSCRGVIRRSTPARRLWPTPCIGSSDTRRRASLPSNTCSLWWSTFARFVGALS